jgi:hypothetical protein
VVPSETDILRERAKAAKNEAIDNRNDIRELEQEIRALEKERPRPGRAAELTERRADLAAARRRQAMLDIREDAAAKAYSDSTKPLVDRLREGSEKLESYKNVSKESRGIDDISKEPSGDIHVDHVVSLKRMSLKKGFDKLPYNEQLEIANMEGNLKAMHGPANSSKGDMTWREWGDRAKKFGYTQEMIDDMIKLEEILEARIDNAIARKLAARYRVPVKPGANLNPAMEGQVPQMGVAGEAPRVPVSPELTDLPGLTGSTRPVAKGPVRVEAPPTEAAPAPAAEQEIGVIKGEPGKRSMAVGGGHDVIEVPDSSMPGGIGCELHSPPPWPKIPCPPGMGSKLVRQEQLGEDILEIFSEKQQKLTNADLEADLLEQSGINESRKPGGKAVPQHFDVGNWAHEHAEELIPESKLPKGLDKEFKIVEADRRIDRIDWANRKIYEVKPDTPTQIAVGENQIRRYLLYLNKYHRAPGTPLWTGEVVTYDRAAVIQYLKKIGWIK